MCVSLSRQEGGQAGEKSSQEPSENRKQDGLSWWVPAGRQPRGPGVQWERSRQAEQGWTSGSSRRKAEAWRWQTHSSPWDLGAASRPWPAALAGALWGSS